MSRLLRRHYLPLFDSDFLKLYNDLRYYSETLRFTINGHLIEPSHVSDELNLEHLKGFFVSSRQKKRGYGIFGLSEAEYPLAPGVCGVLLCTRGKVVKMDFLDQFPGESGPWIFGLVEVPEFITFLTTSKTEFIRKGNPRDFERLYDPIRQEFKKWLTHVGIQTTEVITMDEALKLERELTRLIEDVPELKDFFGFPIRRHVLRATDNGTISAEVQEGVQATSPVGEGNRGLGESPLDKGEDPGNTLVEDEPNPKSAEAISRRARRGPKVTFVKAKDRVELAWVEGNVVVINEGHPAYDKARRNGFARRLHCLFAIGTAVQRFLEVEGNGRDVAFVDRMMGAWGKK